MQIRTAELQGIKQQSRAGNTKRRPRRPPFAPVNYYNEAPYTICVHNVLSSVNCWICDTLEAILRLYTYIFGQDHLIRVLANFVGKKCIHGALSSFGVQTKVNISSLRNK